MPSSPEVLLLDDGELDDVQQILDSVGAGYGRVRGSAIAHVTPAPTRLLVTTPRRIDAVPLTTSTDDRVVRIVVVNEDSPTLRAQLRDVGFDYLVRRPVHIEALRLMLLRCLYSGAERRRDARVPVGLEVSYKTGLLPRRAVLADLSTRGCRILSKWAAEPGKRISLALPAATGERALTVRGNVVRMKLDESIAPEGPYSAAVEFEPLTDPVRKELERLLSLRARGPASIGNADAVPTEAAAPAAEPAADAGAQTVGIDVDVRLVPETAAPEPETPEPTIQESAAAELRVDAPPVPAPAEGDLSSAASATEAAGEALDDEGEDSERRDGPRATYGRRVPAFGERAMRVLVARDLSMGGMRVEHDSGLCLGDRLHLAIYGTADEEPFLVWATVDRDDGERGLLLAFDALPPEIEERLDNVVVNLPAVESLHDDEARAMGTVVTEILTD